MNLSPASAAARPDTIGLMPKRYQEETLYLHKGNYFFYFTKTGGR
jgi:hypothetical protein